MTDRNLALRDKFLVERGLWGDFTNWLPMDRETLPKPARPIDDEGLVERIVEAVIDSANLVAHDGYYEIDQESACRAILPIIREHLKND